MHLVNLWWWWANWGPISRQYVDVAYHDGMVFGSVDIQEGHLFDLPGNRCSHVLGHTRSLPETRKSFEGVSQDVCNGWAADVHESAWLEQVGWKLQCNIHTGWELHQTLIKLRPVKQYKYSQTLVDHVMCSGPGVQMAVGIWHAPLFSAWGALALPSACRRFKSSGRLALTVPGKNCSCRHVVVWRL